MGNWTTNGTAHTGGDSFGDHQTGESYNLSFTNPDHPDARVSVYFGVVLNQANQYTADSYVEFELFTHSGDQYREEVLHQSELFLQDHPTLDRALRDRDQEIDRWKAMTFPGTMLGFNGQELPNHPAGT